MFNKYWRVQTANRENIFSIDRQPGTKLIMHRSLSRKDLPVNAKLGIRKVLSPLHPDYKNRIHYRQMREDIITIVSMVALGIMIGYFIFR